MEKSERSEENRFGTFKIMHFDLEMHFLSSNIKKQKYRSSGVSSGKTYQKKLMVKVNLIGLDDSNRRFYYFVVNIHIESNWLIHSPRFIFSFVLFNLYAHGSEWLKRFLFIWKFVSELTCSKISIFLRFNWKLFYTIKSIVFIFAVIHKPL